MSQIYETAGGVLVRDGKILLGKRRDDEDNYAGFWDIPAGHIDPGETPEQTLVRELKEELDIVVTKYKNGFVIEEKDPTSGRDYRHHIFYVTAWQGEPRNTGEAEKIQWVRPHDAAVLKCTLSADNLQRIAADISRL